MLHYFLVFLSKLILKLNVVVLFHLSAVMPKYFWKPRTVQPLKFLFKLMSASLLLCVFGDSSCLCYMHVAPAFLASCVLLTPGNVISSSLGGSTEIGRWILYTWILQKPFCFAHLNVWFYISEQEVSEEKTIKEKTCRAKHTLWSTEIQSWKVQMN